MDEHFERIMATYIEAEAEYERELADAGADLRRVGPEFFGPALDEWETKWRERAPVLNELRRLSASSD
jgi:hypothetical protein